MRYLKQSTATAILIGPFLSDSDGKTVQGSLTVASIDVDLYKTSDTHPLTKTDITPAASGSSNDMAHVANGFYSLELTTSNTDTVGRCVITANISGSLPVWHEFMVLPTLVYDSLIGGTDKLQVHADEITNNLITAAAIATGAIDADAIADNAIDAGAIADNAITAAKIATDAIDADALADGAITSGVFAAGAITAVAIATNAIDDDALAADAVTAIQSGLATTANVSAVETDTQDIQARLPAALVSGRMDSSVGAMVANTLTASALATDAVTELIAAVFANDLESGKTFAQAILDLWATNVGDATANDADDPTSASYDSPDGTVQVTHTLTGTTRTKV